MSFLFNLGIFMAVEFLVGTSMSIIAKYGRKVYAHYSGNLSVFSVRDYASKHYGEAFVHQATFAVMKTQPTFVIVKCESNSTQVKQETFFNVWGESTNVTYRSGEYLYSGFSSLDSPIFLVLVFLPVAIGLFGTFIASNPLAFPLLISGIVWMIVIYLAAIFGNSSQADWQLA